MDLKNKIKQVKKKLKPLKNLISPNGKKKPSITKINICTNKKITSARLSTKQRTNRDLIIEIYLNYYKMKNPSSS